MTYLCRFQTDVKTEGCTSKAVRITKLCHLYVIMQTNIETYKVHVILKKY
jgi:hypothetical protein